jgi:hypothetical protein
LIEYALADIDGICGIDLAIASAFPGGIAYFRGDEDCAAKVDCAEDDCQEEQAGNAEFDDRLSGPNWGAIPSRSPGNGLLHRVPLRLP